MSNEILRPESLQPAANKFCPGCLHPMSLKLMMQSLEELGIAKKAVMVVAVGCSTMELTCLKIDMISVAHGRAPAVATGIKRVQPETFVFTYQGDGDLASIGLSEILCAANRGERFSVIFANNSTYGMTGGQLAPTSLVGQVTTTTPLGRNADVDGYPINMCDLISQFKAPSYIARCALNSPANVVKAKASIKKAFQNQLEGKPFSFVELLTNCPTNWHLSPLDSLKHIEDASIPNFPLGIFRDR